MKANQLDIRTCTVIASLLISAIIFLSPFPYTPNDDAYIYIRTAEIFLNEGLAAAFKHYAWATYAVLIALTSKFGIELFSAAYLVNTLFYALLTFSFVSIVREMHDSRLVLAFSAIVILLYPPLNEYRTYVIRDTGFLALTLLSLWMYLLFAKTGLIKFAFGFCSALLFATSLRPEALFYLLVTPLALLFDHRFDIQTRRHRFLLLAGLVMGIGLVTIIALALAGMNVFALLAQFLSVYQPFIMNTFAPDPAQADAVANALFGDHAANYSQEYIAIFMAAGLFTILLANMFDGIGGPFFWVLVYGAVQKQWRVHREVAVPMLLFMLTNALVLLGFLFITRYLTSRYAIVLCLMLVLLVPQILAHYLENQPQARRRSAVYALSLFLAYCAFDAYITFGDSKYYVFDAIDWVAANTSANAAVVTNNHAVAYRSGRVENYDKVTRSLTAAEILQTVAGDIVVVELNFEMTQLLATPEITPILEQIAVLPDAEDPQLMILRRINP